jgi:SAM-dependent methyltransferase
METKKGNWIPENTIGNPFFIECDKIVSDDKLFEHFKQNRVFCQIVGNDIRSENISNLLYEKIKKTPIINDIEKYKTNDLYGNPIKYYYNDIGEISPGTLYFLDVLNDILEKFGDISKMNILEIGSGYGGQAKIILDYGCNQYTCLDVKEPLSLCEKYLKLFNYSNAEFISTNDIDNIHFEDKKYDLVISNWCLSEFDTDGINFYIEKIIRYSKEGYFLMNIWDDGRKQFLVENMSKYFSQIEIESESVETHANKNFLLYVKK